MYSKLPWIILNFYATEKDEKRPITDSGQSNTYSTNKCLNTNFMNLHTYVISYKPSIELMHIDMTVIKVI